MSIISNNLTSLTTQPLTFANDTFINIDKHVASMLDCNLQLDVCPILENCLDYAINNNNMLFLTDTIDLNKSIKIVKQELIHTYINTELKIAKNQSKLGININNENNVCSPVLTSINLNDSNYTKFTIELLNEHECYIYHRRRQDDQKFYLISSVYGISFDVYPEVLGVYFITDATKNRAIIYKNINNTISVLSFDTYGNIYFRDFNGILDDITDNDSYIVFDIDGTYSDDRFNINNTFCSYTQEYTESLNKGTVDVQFNNNLIVVNYNNVYSYGVETDVVTLKNELTYNNAQGVDNITYGLSHNQFRYYRTIHSGIDTLSPTYNILLNYDNFVKNYELKSGKLTYFNMPQSMGVFSRININALKFAEHGAIASSHPLKADKIFKKQSSYHKTTDSGNPTNENNGMYLCSWLKAGATINDKPVWMDRYYFADCTAPNDALGASINIVYDTLKPLSTEVYDVPSALTFEPGCSYVYHHIGQIDIINNIINLEKTACVSKVNTENSISIDKISTNQMSICVGVNQLQEDEKSTAHIFGDANKGICLYNERTITPLSFILKGSGTSTVLNCYNTNGLLLHGTLLGSEVSDVQIQDYMHDICVVYAGVKGGVDVTTVASLQHTYTIGIYTYDLKLKYYIASPTKTVLLDGDNLYIQVQGTVIYKIDLLSLDYSILQGISLCAANAPGTLRLVKYQNNVYIHAYQKLCIKNNAFIVLDDTLAGSSEISIIDPLIPTNKRVNTYIQNSYKKVYDILLDGDTLICIADVISTTLTRQVLFLNLNTNNITDYIDLTGKNVKQVDLCREFTNNGYQRSIIVYDNTSLFKYDYTGQLLNTATLDTAIYRIPYSMNGYNSYYKYVDALYTVSIKLLHRKNLQSLKLEINIPKAFKLNGINVITTNLDVYNGIFEVFVNNTLVDRLTFAQNTYDLNTTFDGSIYINNTYFYNNVKLCDYVKQPTYYQNNSNIEFIKVFNKVLDYTDINLYIQKYFGINDMSVNLPIFKTNMIDEIERFFKFKGTGYKTNSYNIVINNASNQLITDDIRNAIEAEILAESQKIAPLNTQLNTIKWQ